MIEADLAMPDSPVAPPSIYDRLHGKAAHVPVTLLLIAANLLVFGLMLGNGAGLWHAQNSIQLAWGANFGPATQDGQWWRLGSALFLHFGLIHLAMNLWALWDGGQLVERMFGHLRFIIIYLASGLCGNLLSLVIQGNEAVSGGASGAIFGVYGALLVFVWRERQQLNPGEFRWLFWGALGFSAVSITLGLIIPGIDNSAHIGGLSRWLPARHAVRPRTDDIQPVALARSDFLRLTTGRRHHLSRHPYPATRLSLE
jgi:rhomboid protease GluP